MAIDPTGIIEGAIGSLLTEHTKKILAGQDEKAWSVAEILQEICTAIKDFEIWYRNTQAGEGDIFHYKVIYKADKGPLYTPSKAGRQNLLIFSPVAATLNVAAPGLLPFNLALSGASWATLNFPDETAYSLDSSYTSDSLTIWQRATNGV